MLTVNIIAMKRVGRILLLCSILTKLFIYREIDYICIDVKYYICIDDFGFSIAMDLFTHCKTLQGILEIKRFDDFFSILFLKQWKHCPCGIVVRLFANTE